MIVVNAVVESTEANIAALREAIAEMERCSRAEEGCLDYTFSTELNRPGVLRITEKWSSLEALKAHFEQPHMAAFRAAMAEHPATVRATFYDAEELESPLA